MRILCICDGGNSRSGTMANILRRLGHDALSVSAEKNSRATLSALCDWAERVYALSDEAKRVVPSAIRINVGEDHWGQTMAPPLVARCLDALWSYSQANLVFRDRIPDPKPFQADKPDTSDQGW